MAVSASVRAVGDWENDRRKPRNRLGALEEVLGVSFSGEPERPPPDPLEELLGSKEEADAVRRKVREQKGPQADHYLSLIEDALRQPPEGGSAAGGPAGPQARRLA